MGRLDRLFTGPVSTDQILNQSATQIAGKRCAQYRPAVMVKLAEVLARTGDMEKAQSAAEKELARISQRRRPS